MRNMDYFALPLAALGVFSDYVRNKKNEKLSDQIDLYRFESTMSIDEKIRISKNNHPYHRSNVSMITSTVALAGAAFIGKIPAVKNNYRDLENLQNIWIFSLMVVC